MSATKHTRTKSKTEILVRLGSDGEYRLPKREDLVPGARLYLVAPGVVLDASLGEEGVTFFRSAVTVSRLVMRDREKLLYTTMYSKEAFVVDVESILSEVLVSNDEFFVAKR